MKNIRSILLLTLLTSLGVAKGWAQDRREFLIITLRGEVKVWVLPAEWEAVVRNEQLSLVDGSGTKMSGIAAVRPRLAVAPSQYHEVRLSFPVHPERPLPNRSGCRTSTSALRMHRSWTVSSGSMGRRWCGLMRIRWSSSKPDTPVIESLCKRGPVRTAWLRDSLFLYKFNEQGGTFWTKYVAVLLLDATGKFVRQQNVQRNLNRLRAAMDVSKLPAGTYYLH